jgi:hypothetical protein
MQRLIKHLLQENSHEILEKSLKNCHCKGLHSIVFLEAKGKTIRLYITDKDHELHWPSLAFHPHHCNLTLHMIKGFMINTIVGEGNKNIVHLDKYLYHSHITEGQMKFELLKKNDPLSILSNTRLNKGDSIFLDAKTIHTVECEVGAVNAWLVYEGKEDENYKPFCWSNKNLNEIPTTGLYEKFKDMEEINNYLTEVLE